MITRGPQPFSLRGHLSTGSRSECHQQARVVGRAAQVDRLVVVDDVLGGRDDMLLAAVVDEGRMGRKARLEVRAVAGPEVQVGTAPVVLGADLNLGSGDSPDLKACLPPYSALVDDGGPQHVVATPEYVVDDHRTIDLRGTTDHPGLLVSLAPAPGS